MPVQSLALLSGLRIHCRSELWCRSQTAIQPLSWKPPQAEGVALKSKKKKKKKKKKKERETERETERDKDRARDM